MLRVPSGSGAALPRQFLDPVAPSTAALQWNAVSRSTDFDMDSTPLRLLDRDRNIHTDVGYY